MIENLVSIITPCYNGEKYINRFLESVLNQTYKNIEIIIINDGSNDNTEKEILKYKEIFLKNNIQFTYIYQDNAGQAEAINKGLKIFRGEFLTWPDSDDTLHPDSIKEKVEFLKKNPEYGFVITDANIIDEKTEQVIGTLEHKKKIKENIFEDLIFENDIWYAPGCYMVRSKAFFLSNPKGKIYSSRGGQNWQMLLPVAYSYKCGYIKKKLYNYYQREDSHSHKNKKDYKKQLEKLNKYEDILNVVLEQMKLIEIYKKKLNIKYERKRLRLAFYFNNQKELEKEFYKLKENDALDIKTILIYIIRKK